MGRDAPAALRTAGEAGTGAAAGDSLAAAMPSADDPAAAARRIIHIDMDAFYASVEQRDRPELRGKPVAVGGARARGVVAAASYEARRFGVRSAMASVTARRKCPELIFVPPRFDAYKAVSAQIRAIFADYTDLVQPLSLDEAYLDVTGRLDRFGSATAIARAIKSRILAATGLTASAGVSYNKFLAKLASDHRKPDGLFVITPEMGPDFVAALPVGKFHGVGPATAARMERLGIHTGADLRAQSQAFLTQHFGKSGEYYYLAARGVDHRPVVSDRQAKSIGSERTFERDLTEWDEAAAAVAMLLAKSWGVCARHGLAARTVTLKVKYADFRIATRSRSASDPIGSEAEAGGLCLDLLRPLFPPRRGIRLLGVTFSNLEPAGATPAAQLSLALP